MIVFAAIACSWEAGDEGQSPGASCLDGNAKMYEVTLDLRMLGGDLLLDTEAMFKADDSTNDLWWFQITP